MPKLTTQDILSRKKSHTKITALTAYDYPFAKLVDEAEMDIVLVGDSLGMVCLGYESTAVVSMDEMVHHGKAACRAVKNALVVIDMPAKSYLEPIQAVQNAKRLIADTGADAVKPEGGRSIFTVVKALREAGIQVMGHLGMTPQSVDQMGGYKVQGKTKEAADRIFEDALELERLGVFSIVLECVPHTLAKRVSEALKVPTIGIGAGPDTDGQVLVLHDILGIESNVHPKFVRKYADLNEIVRQAIATYKQDVLEKKYPSLKESFE